jgi:uncharacterized protein (DUF1330 family)
MSKGYIIVRATVTDPEKWGEYIAASKPVLERYEGKPVVRGGKCEIVEGTGAPRNVVLEFPSYENALGYAKSADYLAAKALRQGAGTLDMTVVEGV